MTLLALPRIEQRLREHQPLVLDPDRYTRQAAVAAILRQGASGTEALFIKRAQRKGDVWSGHMAFPGGHAEAGDPDLAATAIRETREEIGLDLQRHGRLLGHLNHMDVNPMGGRTAMLVVPFVFLLTGEPPPLQLNHEVADVLWGSLHEMFHGHSATRRDMAVGGGMQPFPGYGVRDEIVWGLTYQMVNGFFATLDPAWRAPRVG